MKKRLIGVSLIIAIGNFGLCQQRVGIGITAPLGTLDVARGTALEGTAIFRGTNHNSHFNWNTNEDTYLRGGKPGSHILLNDLAGLGNVGIGTNAPYFKFTVQTANDNWGIVHNTGTIGVGTWAGTYGGTSGGWYGTYSNHPLMFSTNNGGAQMTILQSGNVGIGITIPEATLDVARGSAISGTAIFRGATHASAFNYSATEDTYIRGGKNGSKVIINDGPMGNVGVGTQTPADKLSVLTATSNYGFTHTDGVVTVGSWIGVGGGWYGTKTNHPLNFFTNNGNAQMIIQPNGQVSVRGDAATINPDPNVNFVPPFTVNGTLVVKQAYSPFVEWSLTSYFGGNLSVHKNGLIKAFLDNDGNWNTGSDNSLKENILPYKPVLENLKQILVSTYRYKSNPDNSRSFGLIAQDVAQYFPEIVSETQDKDGQKLLGIAYGKTGVLALKAIQEQQLIIETLQKQMELLIKEVVELKKRLPQ